jgi:hypothetical protein
MIHRCKKPHLWKDKLILESFSEEGDSGNIEVDFLPWGGCFQEDCKCELRQITFTYLFLGASSLMYSYVWKRHIVFS